MNVQRESKVRTEVQWIATIKMDHDEFDELVDLLQNVAEQGTHLSEQAFDLKQRLTIGAPEPDGPKRPITELKRKAAQNGG